jgi:hypothetical protein
LTERLSGVTCPHWVLAEGFSCSFRKGWVRRNRLGLPLETYQMMYFFRKFGTKNSAHYWTGDDTVCKLWSSGGMNKNRPYGIFDDPQGHPLCAMCHQLKPMPDAPPRKEKVPRAPKKAKKQRSKRKRSTTSILPKYYGDVSGIDFLSSYEWRRVRMEALKKYGPVCQCCGASPSTGAVMNVDHIKPRKLFHQLALDVSNLQILCHECNHGKGNWDTTEWREYEDPPELIRLVRDIGFS